MDCTRGALIAASTGAATISEVAFAAVGFGPAILYQISWQLLAVAGISRGGLAEAVGNIVAIEAPTGVAQVWFLRRRLAWRLVVLWCVPYGLVCPVGTVALQRFGQSPWMKRLLGALLLAVAGGQLLHRLRRGQSSLPRARPSIDVEPRSWSTAGAVVLASATSGLLRGLFGVAGPPFMVLLMYFPMDQAKFRAVAACQRVSAVLVQGTLLGLGDDITPSCWRMYAGLMAGGLLGVALGNLAAPHVDKEAFQRWILLFLASGALLMLCSGVQVLSMAAAVLVGLAVLAALVLPVVAAARRRKLASRAAARSSLASQDAGCDLATACGCQDEA